ncbi:MAG: Spy/CpxP family protein refolding chaperone [Azoarcus sp.]|jgi:hypothetical protein|nr:Spy/CpxP family protein refolding chaperone [Azoarcus sp.]
MKRWVKTSLVAALAATTFLSGSAMARGCGYGWGGGGYGPGWGGGWRNASPELMKEQMEQRIELQLAQLELALALTSEQRSAWADFKKAATTRTDVMLKEMENRRNAALPNTAAERMAFMEEFSKRHSSMLADMRKSVEAFYSKLSAPQKTVFDAEAATLMHPMYGGGGCGMGGPGCMMGGPRGGYGNPGFGRGGGRGGWR